MIKKIQVPMFRMECPRCGYEHFCMGSDVVDVTTIHGRVFACVCGYKARFAGWQTEEYATITLVVNDYGDISLEDEELNV